MANAWLSDKDEIADEIRNLVGNVKKLRMAVAFWGKHPVRRLGLDRVTGSKVRIVCNLASGGTNPDAIQELMAHGGQIQQLDDLHAKVYLSEQRLIVGSANVSANGLGLQGNECAGWSEACIGTSDAKMMSEADAWFEEQWRRSRKIEQADLDAALVRWETQRRARPMPPPAPTSGKSPVLDLAPETIEGQRIFVVLASDGFSAAAKKSLKEYREKGFANAGGYENWGTMPLNATFLAFQVAGRSKTRPFKVAWDGCWTAPRDKFALKAATFRNGQSTLQIVWPTTEPFPIKSRKKDWERDVHAVCEVFRDRGRKDWHEWWIPLEEFQAEVAALR